MKPRREPDPHPPAPGPLLAQAGNRWSRPKTYSFLRDWKHVPISDSELLQVSHHLPVGVRVENDLPVVVAILDPGYHRTPVLDSRGRWRPPYVPLVLRCLPFHLAGDGEPSEADLRVAENLGLVGPQGENAVATPDGRISAQTRSVFKALCEARAGQQRLSAAADKLLIAGSLMAFESTGPDGPDLGEAAFLTVNARQFDSLSGLRLCAAVRDDFLALELAGACLFSQRHLPPQVGTRSEPSAEPASLYDIAADLDYVIRGIQKIGVNLDSSDLFDIKDLR